MNLNFHKLHLSRNLPNLTSKHTFKNRDILSMFAHHCDTFLEISLLEVFVKSFKKILGHFISSVKINIKSTKSTDRPMICLMVLDKDFDTLRDMASETCS